MPGSVAPMFHICRPLGRLSRRSRLTTCCWTELWTSTSGASPVTVIVSSSAPTFISPFTVATVLACSVTPSRLNVLKPCSEKVTAYTPGRRSTILNCPCSSVTTDRVRSISAGLAASTVTPGRTAPVSSLTTPAMELCANDVAGTRTNSAADNESAAATRGSAAGKEDMMRTSNRVTGDRRRAGPGEGKVRPII